MEFPANGFWDFSLEVYGREGVAPACLALQERHGVDVNFLLFCAWLGRAGFAPEDAEGLARRHAVVAAWHGDVVRALRAVRKGLKDYAGPVAPDLAQALRRQLANLEIDAEHVEQLALAAGAGDPPPGQVAEEEAASNAVANLSAYLAFLGVRADVGDRAGIETILAAAFPGLTPARVRGLCDSLAP